MSKNIDIAHKNKLLTNKLITKIIKKIKKTIELIDRLNFAFKTFRI